MILAEKEFAQHLAREFGKPCWRSMLASISAETVIEWQAYFNEHGFTHTNQNLQAAQLCATVWNSATVPLGNTEPLSLFDFLLTRQETAPTHSPERTDDELMHLSAEAGGMRIECPEC